MPADPRMEAGVAGAVQPSQTQAGLPPEGEPWTVLGMIVWSTEWLARRGVPEPRLSAEHLLSHVLGIDRLGLYLAFDRPLESAELGQYKPLLKRRARHEPLQYIVGHTSFRDLDLKTDGRGLIPRPETEELVGLALDWASRWEGPPPAALDLGTGTGAIALSLRREGSFGRVIAVDLSADALALARENAGRHGEDVEFRRGSLYEPLDPDERFDLIVSNPPYVTDAEMKGLEPQVREWEPDAALRGGEDGLTLIREIVRGAPTWLRNGGLLALEIGRTQGDAVMELVFGTNGLGAPSIRQDLAGRDRFLVAVAGAV